MGPIMCLRRERVFIVISRQDWVSLFPTRLGIVVSLSCIYVCLIILDFRLMSIMEEKYVTYYIYIYCRR